MADKPPFLASFQSLFRGRETCYGQYGDGEKKSIQTIRAAVPESAWIRHLNGEGPYLGIVPICVDNSCYFGAIDVDDDTINHQALANEVKELGLPLIVCRSKSSAAHLYLFLEEPAPAVIVAKTLRTWINALGYKDNSDGRPIEVFPKQTALRPKDIGNWINLPYYGSDASTRLAINADGETLTLQQFIAVAEMMKVKDGSKLSQIQLSTGNIFDDGPPCLQTLNVKGFAEGSRNSGLYNIAIFFRMAYGDDEWKARVSRYNLEAFAPPLTSKEVETVIFSIEKKDYSYNCDELPIQPFCQKALCNKRKYGISRLRASHSVKAFPTMSSLRKIMTDPPRWIVAINGQDVELTTDNLTQLLSLRKVAFERLNMVLPTIRPSDYDNILRDLLEASVQIDAPDDAGTIGQFLQLVGQFLIRRKSAETREDILQGLPFEERGKVYFRSSDLMAFLDRHKFFKYSPAEVYTILRTRGAAHQPMRLKDVVIKVWTMPVPKDEQTQDFDAIPIEKLGGTQF